MDPEEAVGNILEFTPEIPTWPQLPRMGFRHNMIVQFATGIPGVVVDEETKNVFLNLSKTPAHKVETYYERLLGENADNFRLDEEYFPGLHALAAHARQIRSARAVKGHMSGPVTMGTQVMSERKTPVLYEQTEMEILLRTLKMKAKWQSVFLKDLNPNPILLVDEPSMTLLGSPCVPLQKEMAVNLINEVLGEIDAIKGIHCCGNTDWPVLLETGIDILSFDAYSWAHTIALYPSEVESFISRGGRLAWGITPTTDAAIETESADLLMKRLHEGMSRLVEKGIDMDEVMESSIITPACGLGLVAPLNAVKALGMTREISARMRKERETAR